MKLISTADLFHSVCRIVRLAAASECLNREILKKKGRNLTLDGLSHEYAHSHTIMGPAFDLACPALPCPGLAWPGLAGLGIRLIVSRLLISGYQVLDMPLTIFFRAYLT